MEQLPFEITPQIPRYLHSLIAYEKEFMLSDTGATVLIESYLKNEHPTDYSESNNSSFWNYLTEIGAIKIVEPKEVWDKDGSRLIDEKSGELYVGVAKYKDVSNGIIFARIQRIGILDPAKIEKLNAKAIEELSKPDSLGPISFHFDENQNVLYIGDKSVDLSNAPIQRDLITMVLKNPLNTYDECFYAELDPISTELDKQNHLKLKNAAYALRRKLQFECSINDFFIKINTKSFKINDKYRVAT